MCDTMVAMPSVTKNGEMLFAKNSDRSANEPHLVVRYGAKDFDLETNPTVKTTYITIPQAAHTHEVVLLKPDWIWGAEMGFNEFGLNIGNEAVFTREKKGEESLIGMDFLRLALERTKTAKEALELIISLLGVYGQGGNCGFDHEFHYHNSFLIADGAEAYVLETAGRYYAAKKVKDFYAISNGLSIGSDYDIIHPDAINNAIKKRRHKLDRKFSFSASYSDKLFTHFAKSKSRRCQAIQKLEANRGDITTSTMMDILRTHAPNYKENGNSVGSICMHAGGLIGDHTTGSYVASLGKEKYYFITGSSLPCLSIFKPMVFENAPIPTEDEESAKTFWLRLERLNRLILSGQIDKAAYIQERDAFEEKFLTEFENSPKKRIELSEEIWKKARSLAEKYLEPFEGKDIVFAKGSASYKRYWRKKTAVLDKSV